MTISKAMIEPQRDNLLHQNLRTLLSSDNSKVDDDDNDQERAVEDYDHRHRRNDDECSSSYFPSPMSTGLQCDHSYYSYPNSTISSPYLAPSPFIQQSPYHKSPWIYYSNNEVGDDDGGSSYGLIGSLYREEGHICSMASCGGLLYTGSDSRNVRVWKDMQEFSGFKSSSGLVKAIVVLGDRIFTGHQDGKIRVWRARRGGSGGGGGDSCKYARVGTLPTTRDMLMKSVNPKNYVEVRRRKKVPWIRHYDAVSCLCVDEERGLLYSGSWDKTLKVWRISDFKCLESIRAHDDAVNSVAVTAGGFVFTGSADGTVKSWRRELVGRSPRHILVEALLRGDHAVTSLAADSSRRRSVLYAGSSDGSVSFWTARDKHSLMSYGGALRGHKMAVLCLAVAGGSDLVMSGSADSSICVWRWEEAVEAHSLVAVMTGHGGPVKCLAVEDDGADDEGKKKNWVVYSGSLDKSVKVWRVSDQESLPEVGA